MGARATYTAASEAWSVFAYGTNLTDEEYHSFGQLIRTNSVIYQGAPREIRRRGERALRSLSEARGHAWVQEGMARQGRWIWALAGNLASFLIYRKPDAWNVEIGGQQLLPLQKSSELSVTP